MSENSSKVFLNCCLMNLMLGMSYYDFFPAIEKLNEIFTSFSEVWILFLYPLAYILLVPLTFNLTSKYFSACNFFSWLLLLCDVLMKLFLHSEWSMILGNLFTTFCTALMLPAYSIIVKKDKFGHPRFLELTFGFLAHPLGMGLRLTSSGIIANSAVYVLKLAVIDIVIILLIISYFTNPAARRQNTETHGFFKSLKTIWNDQNLLILFCCTSAQIGLIYAMSTVFESFYKTNIMKFEVSEENADYYVKILGVVYCLAVILGGFIANWLKNSAKFVGNLTRMYAVFPFLLIFFLGFVIRGLVFYLIYCVLSGLSLLHLVGLMHYCCLGYQEKLKKNLQPVSLILSIYFGLIFAGFVKFLMSVFFTYGLHRSSLFVLIQFLISTSFLAIYDDYDNKFSQDKTT